uniref:histidine kinase n=1 Tax=Helianthus annuus TaxID=4232 RepID=A0A251TGI5_HELAN
MAFFQVYVLALPYDEVQSRMHWNLVIVSVLSSLMILAVAISMVLTLKLARKEMCLTAALVKQKEKTQQLERKSKNQSVAFETASHDIRASLAAISGSVEMSINENHQGSELATDLRIVQSSTKYLQGLLNSILDTSKIEAGKMELEEKPFDLVKVVEGVVDLFYPVGIKKEVDVILDVQDDLLTKYSQVKGDERRLKQILSNLLSNAIKFTSEGHVSVGVRARAMSQNVQSSITASDHDRFERWRSCLFCRSNDKCGGDVEAVDEVVGDSNCMEFVFEVNDTGKGIAKEKQASIFENYVQVKETEHEFEGTGLGLAIVQSLVRLMGGEISIVDKEPGEKGTSFRFHVVFKVIRSDQHVISDEEKVNMSSGSNTGSNTPFCSPKRRDYNSSTVVLFISSDERRKVSQKFIRARGVKVVVAKTVGELSETLKEFRQSASKVCSPGSYINLSFGYLTRPGRSPNKEVPLSALDGTDASQARMSNPTTQTGFILLVVDTTRANFRELCKVVAEFRKESKDACFRVVWLGFRCMQAHGLDEKQLPPSDVIIPMPLHGSRLYSLIDLLPEFRSKFPCTPPRGNPHTPERQVEVEEITRISPNKSPLRGKKVLLVEDNSMQQMIAKRIFLKNGVIFDMCTNGKEALTFVSKGLTDQKDLGASHILPYDYILMDCQMPVMDGCEATWQIRQMEKEYGVHIPIIGLSAHGEGEELNKFVKGIDSHVSKPLNEHKLLKVIEDLHSRN